MFCKVFYAWHVSSYSHAVFNPITTTRWPESNGIRVTMVKDPDASDKVGALTFLMTLQLIQLSYAPIYLYSIKWIGHSCPVKSVLSI